LKVKLVKNHIWLSGREKGLGNKWKASFTANLPTEETWTMPDRNGMNGKVYATKPLSYNGNLIDNFWFEFKNGKVINHGAKVGKQVLDAILKIDEGSSRTGEISLVPNSSPINQSGIIFYSTLYDENATCHIALGASYPNNIVGGITKTREQLKKLGGNDSAVHIDFMFGSDDLNIYGYKGKNKPICICKNGKLLV
jgi:aminopeptidase